MSENTQTILHGIHEDFKTVAGDISDIKGSIIEIKKDMEHKVEDLNFVKELGVFKEDLHGEIKACAERNHKVTTNKTDWSKVKVNCIYMSVIGGAISAPVVAVLTMN